MHSVGIFVYLVDLDLLRMSEIVFSGEISMFYLSNFDSLTQYINVDLSDLFTYFQFIESYDNDTDF